MLPTATAAKELALASTATARAAVPTMSAVPARLLEMAMPLAVPVAVAKGETVTPATTTSFVTTTRPATSAVSIAPVPTMIVAPVQPALAVSPA